MGRFLYCKCYNSETKDILAVRSQRIPQSHTTQTSHKGFIGRDTREDCLSLGEKGIAQDTGLYRAPKGRRFSGWRFPWWLVGFQAKPRDWWDFEFREGLGLRDWYFFELRDWWGLVGFQTQKWTQTFYHTLGKTGLSTTPAYFLQSMLVCSWLLFPFWCLIINILDCWGWLQPWPCKCLSCSGDDLWEVKNENQESTIFASTGSYFQDLTS